MQEAKLPSIHSMRHSVYMILIANLHIVGTKYKGNKGEGVTIVESLGLAMAVGENKLNCKTLWVRWTSRHI